MPQNDIFYLNNEAQMSIKSIRYKTPFMVGNKNSFGLFGFEFFLFLFLTIRGEYNTINTIFKSS